jgi:hypothetical protein
MAIDPASLILRGRLLNAYYVTQDPHVPLSDTLEDVIRQATKAECEAVAARARFLKELGSVVAEVLAGIEERGCPSATPPAICSTTGFKPRPSSSTPRPDGQPSPSALSSSTPSRGTKANYRRNNSNGR